MNNGILTNTVVAQVSSVEVNEADDQTNAAHPIGISATGRKMHNGRMNNVCKVQWRNQTEEEELWEDEEDMHIKFTYLFE